MKIFFFLILGLVSVARADYRKWYQPIEALDGAQAFVSDSWSGVNYGVDSFFANENYSIYILYFHSYKYYYQYES